MKDKLKKAFGFEIKLVSTNKFEAHGETRTRITVKRPNGKKFYHAIQYGNGEVVAC